MKQKKPYFTLTDICIMSMVAAMGIAIKAIIVPLAQIITGPLFIPGGVVAGGFYMAFLVLGESITGKWGTAIVVALIQGAVVTITGALGSHGAASILTYTMPGLAIDLVYLLMRHRADCAICCFIGGVVANMAGSFSVNLAIFNLSFVPLMLSLAASALSGGLGGLVAHAIGSNVRRLGILQGSQAKTYEKPRKNEFSVPMPEELEKLDEKEN